MDKYIVIKRDNDPKNNIWMTKEFHDEVLKIEAEIWWGSNRLPRISKPEDNVKLAITERGMIGVDNKTMQGYELDDRYPTVKIPLVPINYTTFVRWATGFDV